MAFKETFLIVLLIGVTVCEESQKCPPQEDIPHCDCEEKEDGTLDLHCDGFYTGKSIEDYRKIMQESNLASKKGLKLTFSRFLKPHKLPSNVFDGFPVKSLYFHSCRVSRWADEEGGPAFVGLEDTLESLQFQTSADKASPQNERNLMSLGHLRKLRDVYFHGDDLYNFGNEWFGNGSNSVESVVMRMCRLSSIGNEAFAGLVNLKTIKIVSNKIREVTRSMFPNPANHLEILSLEGNKLTSLPEDIFSNMPALTEVIVSYNPITRLSENVWRPVWSSLKYLGVWGTSLICDDHLEWTFKIRRPKVLHGQCRNPFEKRFKNLREIIDNH